MLIVALCRRTSSSPSCFLFLLISLSFLLLSLLFSGLFLPFSSSFLHQPPPSPPPPPPPPPPHHLSPSWPASYCSSTHLLICSLNSLLCSVHRTLSPDKPLMRAEAAPILFRHLSASSISVCGQEKTLKAWIKNLHEHKGHTHTHSLTCMHPHRHTHTHNKRSCTLHVSTTVRRLISKDRY